MNHKIVSLFLAGVMLLPGCKKEQEEVISYDDIIKRVEEEHSNLTTYSDNSTLTANYVTSNPYQIVKTSTVAYSSDGRFRYEYYQVGDNNSKYIIHRDGDLNIQSWWDVTDELKDHDDISLALAAATGVSDQTAFIVPALLLPDEFDGHNIFKTLSGIERGEDEIIGGMDCYLITGFNIFNDLCKIYILKDNFLIKRYSDSHQYDTFDFYRVIDYYPEMNITIPDEEFVFGAP